MYSKIYAALSLLVIAQSASAATTTITGIKDYNGATMGTVCNGQSESQEPVFLVKDGGTLKNVHLKAGGAADGVHCEGSCTLENVVWDAVCEDAATMLGGSGKTMWVKGGSASTADDKVFQHNGKGGTVKISNNFQTFDRIQRLWASCGDCANNGGPRYLDLDGVTINGKVVKPDGKTAGYVLRLNANYGDKATVRNLRIQGYKAGSPKVCVEAIGITKAEKDAGAKQVNNGEKWNTTACNISKTDVKAF